jgi:hypothetical protein
MRRAAGPSQPNERRLELFALSPHRGDERVELLTIVAHVHRTGAQLDLGHTVNLGQPALPVPRAITRSSRCPTWGLHGPKVEKIRDAGGVTVGRCLWLVPITKAEREFKKAEGLDALEQRFEATNFDYLDPMRPSVV